MMYIDCHYVLEHGEHSAMSEIKCSVPQESVLGPILLIMCTTDVIRIVEGSGLIVHQYTDDTQIHSSCHQRQSVSLCHDMSDCIRAVAHWTRSDHLQFNVDKMEFIWCVEVLSVSYTHLTLPTNREV